MKNFILFLFFAGLLFESFGQSLTLDTISKGTHDRIYFGIYFMPLLSINSGKKVVPVFNEGFDVTNHYSFKDIKETIGVGYSRGFEIEIRTVKKIYLGLGGSFDYYHYTGSALATVYNYFYVPPQISGPFYINYSFKSYFFGLSLGAHYHYFINKLNLLNFSLAASGNNLIEEKNSNFLAVNSHEYLFKKERTTFGIIGVDYFYGHKILLNLGLRISSQMGTTPHGRQLTSAGFKVGIFY